MEIKTPKSENFIWQRHNGRRCSTRPAGKVGMKKQLLHANTNPKSWFYHHRLSRVAENVETLIQRAHGTCIWRWRAVH